MRHARFHSALVLLVLLGAAGASRACLVSKVVSPQELVAAADAIYWVRATDYVVPLRQRQADDPPRVRFTVVEVFKGPQQREIQFPAALVQTDDPNDLPAPYAFVRPGGRRGNCHAVTYRSGRDYVLFIKGGTPYWSPLAATNEQVFGQSDPWLAWVRANTGLGAARKPGR